MKYTDDKKIWNAKKVITVIKVFAMENAGIDPATSHMRSARSTTWANSPPSFPFN